MKKRRERAMHVGQERDTTTIRQSVNFKASPQQVYETLTREIFETR
jgi:hypothetical protein